MKIISISGLDGSGKSTQIKLLRDYLESQGKRVFYFHAVEFSLAKKIVDFRNKYCLICKLLGKCKVYREKSVIKASALQIFLRKIFLRIDIWRFNLLHTKLRNSGYDYILSDRYFYDSVVNIEFLEKNRREQKFLFFAADLPIYLQTSPETIMRRERVPDQGVEYLKKKKELYDAKITTWDMKIINGEKSKEEIFSEIKNYVELPR